VPTVRFAGKSIECLAGANLRMILLRARLPLYHNVAKAIHCRGFGTCGTCAVRIAGPVSEPTAVETWRLGFPPHNRESGLRLACQISVLGDIEVTRHEGLFGHRTNARDDARRDG
jgi:ferredoxin